MNVKLKISEILNNRLSNTELYLFGSVVYADAYDDVDLVVLYDKTKVSIEAIIEYRKTIKSEILKKLDLKADIILLSYEENLETKFLANAKNELI